MINRPQYIQSLAALRHKNIIKVVTGIRRCGKSTLFELYKEYLIEDGVSTDQMISINFEDLAYEELQDYHKLYQYISEHLIPNKMNYIFLDEIQAVNQYEKAINSLQLKSNVDIYITGSNAYMLSGELSTLLSGRYIEISMQPLSFKEYLTAKPCRSSLSESYANYLTDSSFPGALEFDSKGKVQEYLSGIYHTIVLKDVVARLKISDVFMLESLIKYMFDTIGNLTSTRKISDTMTSDGRTISVHTVERYITGLTDSFILYRVPRYDIKGRQLLRTGDKYYVADIALRSLLLGNRIMDRGHVLENIVFLELIRRGKQVYVGANGNSEVDFITTDDTGLTYYQVTLTVRDEATLQRELAPLMSIQDHYPKYMLTMDNDPNGDYNGIRQVNVLEWLIGDEVIK